MKNTHSIVGIFTLLLFLVTGIYMKQILPELDSANPVMDGGRMMYRASHIYLLLVGLLNLFVGIYYKSFVSRAGAKLQNIGSVLLLAACPVLLYAFWTEPAVVSLDRIFTLIGMVMLLAAGGFTAMAAVLENSRKSN